MAASRRPGCALPRRQSRSTPCRCRRYLFWPRAIPNALPQRDEAAAFRKLVQHGVQLAHVLALEMRGRRRRRFHRRHYWLWHRRSVHTIAWLDARYRRALQRRLASLRRVVLTITEIAPEQRRQAAAKSARLFGDLGFGGSGLLGEVFVFGRAMRRLRRALLPNRLHELDALLAQDA